MRGDRGRSAARLAAAVLLWPLWLAAPASGQPASGQTVAGRWVAHWRVLDNGEDDRLLLELHQSGGTITGTAATIGHRYQVDGTLAGNHLAASFSKGGNGRRLAGDLVGNELHLTYEGVALLASAAEPGDDYPPYGTVALPAVTAVPYNRLAATPPMGWNSWNRFGSRVDDATIRGVADAMVASGMRDAGYVYLNIDDTWEGVRDAKGNLGSNRKFPDMKALAAYVHGRGLKFGLYSSPGPRTCGEYPGSYGHERQDADTFAAWGVDYLKYDWCGARMVYGNGDLRRAYQKMGDALQATGRPIVYSLCEYGSAHVETWGGKAGGNLWRTTGDIRDAWPSMRANIERQAATAPYAGPGHWNDPDMLEVGNGHMTDAEYRTHMTLWAMAAAPLLAGNDVRSMTPATRATLLNREVIAVDQDPLGRQATPRRRGDLETWVKPLADGSVAVAVVNLGGAEADAVVTAADLGFKTGVASARDLWAHAAVQFRDGAYARRVASHDVLLVRLVAKP